MKLRKVVPVPDGVCCEVCTEDEDYDVFDPATALKCDCGRVYKTHAALVQHREAVGWTQKDGCPALRRRGSRSRTPTGFHSWNQRLPSKLRRKKGGGGGMEGRARTIYVRIWNSHSDVIIPASTPNSRIS